MAMEVSMSSFSDAELTYLAKGKLGRLATIDVDGLPHLVPLGWTYNEELDTIDVRGRDFDHTRKFHNVQANPNVALVVDDVVPPWQPRCVLVRGQAQALHDAYGPNGEAQGPTIRITPSQVISWGMDVVDRP
jgi:pyridoxamine 5'-phosphate oxidase family protein